MPCFLHCLLNSFLRPWQLHEDMDEKLSFKQREIFPRTSAILETGKKLGIQRATREKMGTNWCGKLGISCCTVKFCSHVSYILYCRIIHMFYVAQWVDICREKSKIKLQMLYHFLAFVLIMDVHINFGVSIFDTLLRG